VSLVRKAIRFVAESLGKTLLDSAGGRIGEGIGNRIARKIDPEGTYPAPDSDVESDIKPAEPK